MIGRKGSKAQSVSEYAILIGIITLALVGMQVYMKRGIQGVVKMAADEVGSQRDAEETDVLKGTKQQSQSRSITSGATQGTPHLPQGATRRVRAFVGGSQRVDFETNIIASGTQSYTSLKEK